MNRKRQGLTIVIVLAFIAAIALLPFSHVDAQQRQNGLVSWSKAYTVTTNVAAANYLCDGALCPAGTYVLMGQAHNVTAGSTGTYKTQIVSNNGTGSQTTDAFSAIDLTMAGLRATFTYPLQLDGATQLQLAHIISGGPGNVNVTVSLIRLR